jgi:hypothetical protein
VPKSFDTLYSGQPFSSGNSGSTQLVRGAFQFDAGALKNARAVVVNEARVMSGELKKVDSALKSTSSEAQKASGAVSSAMRVVADSFRHAKTEAEAFAKTDLGVIRNGIRGAADEFRNLSLAAGVFAGGGILSSMNMKKTEVAINALAGSAKEANKVFATTQQIADDFKLPYTDLLEGAKELIPVSKRTNVEMDRLLGIMTKLKFAVPDKNFSQLRFSFSELLSGDKTSAQDILSILGSRSDFTRIASLAKDNNVAGALDELEKLLEKANITDETMKQIADSGVSAFDNVGSAVKRAVDAGFRPMLDKYIIPGAQGFADFLNQLRETNPELLQLAAAGTLAVAGISPTLFIISKMIDAYRLMGSTAMTAFRTVRDYGSAAIDTIRSLPDLIKNNSRLLNENAKSWKEASLAAKAGVGIAAVGVGMELGRTAVTGLANAGVQGGDFDRVRAGADPLAIAGERLKQLIIILVDGFLYLIKGLAYAAANIMNAFDQLVNILKLGGTYLEEIFLRFQIAFGDIIYQIGVLLENVMDTTGIKEAGLNVSNDARTKWGENITERSNLEQRLSEGLQLPQEMIDRIEGNYADLRDSVVGGLTEAFFPPVQEAADDVAQQLSDLGQNLGGSLGDMVPTFSDDMVEAFADYQDELKKVQDDAQADRLKENAEYEKAVTDKTKEQYDAQLKAISEFSLKAAEEQTKLGWKIDDLRKEFNTKEIEEQKKFQQEEKKLRREHRLNLLKAAASLDGRALYLELQKYRTEKKNRQEAHDSEKAERQRQLDARIEQMQFELQREQEFKAQQFYNVELPQLQAQQAEELAKLAQAHQERLAQIDAQAVTETQKVTAAFVDTFNKLVEQEGTHQGLMLQTQRAGQEQMRAELAAWWATNAGIISRTAPGVTPNYAPPKSDYASEYPKIDPIPNPSGTSGDANGHMPVQFLSGTTNFFRGGLAQLHPGEGVVRKDTMQMLRRMLGGNVNQERLAIALAGGNVGGGRGGKQISIGSISVPVTAVNSGPGGVDMRDFKRKVKIALEEVIDEIGSH